MNGPDVGHDENGISRKFKGVWIPAWIWLHPGLSPMKKCLLAEIDSLGDEDEPCRASNIYLGKMLGIKDKTIANMLSDLRRLGVLEVAEFKGSYRYLRLAKNPNEGGTFPDSGKVGGFPESGKVGFPKSGKVGFPESGNEKALPNKVEVLEGDSSRERKDSAPVGAAPPVEAKALNSEPAKVNGHPSRFARDLERDFAPAPVVVPAGSRFKAPNGLRGISAPPVAEAPIPPPEAPKMASQASQDGPGAKVKGRKKKIPEPETPEDLDRKAKHQAIIAGWAALKEQGGRKAKFDGKDFPKLKEFLELNPEVTVAEVLDTATKALAKAKMGEKQFWQCANHTGTLYAFLAHLADIEAELQYGKGRGPMPMVFDRPQEERDREQKEMDEALARNRKARLGL